VRPYDLLVIFRRTLAPGSTRLKIYDNSIAQAQKDNRLPMQAQQIYDDILNNIRSVLRESILTKQTRVEIEFNKLEMGRLSHPPFLTEWERLLIAKDDVQIKIPDENTLFRRYLQKLVPDLRQVLLSRGWVLDAGPPRKPTTWKECAECVGQELESRADSKPPREMVNAIQVGSLQMCAYCRRQDHMEICPKRAADVRGDTAKCLADFEMGGRTCNLCNQADHTEEHHRLAVADLLALAGQPGPRNPIVAKQQIETVNEAREREDSTSRRCRFGEDCRQWKRGECPYIHDTKYEGEKPSGSPSSCKGDGKQKSEGKSFDRSTMCYQVWQVARKSSG
jgi:hypothetical protein